MSMYPTDVRNLNTAHVLDLLWKSKPISRVDIAKELNLSKPVITKIINVLLDKSLVNQVNSIKEDTKGGRPKVALTLNSNIGVLVGIEITDSQLRLSVLDPGGTVLYRELNQFDSQTMKSGLVVTQIKNLINEVTKRFGHVLAIGIGLPGLIDARIGTVVKSNAFEIDEPIELAAKLNAELDIPVLCDNDANCAAWGHLFYGQSTYSSNFLYVLFTNHHQYQQFGIGLGFVLNGQIFYGDDLLAGQFTFQPYQDKTRATDGEIMEQFVDKLSSVGRLLNIHQLVVGGEVERYAPHFKGYVEKNTDNFSGIDTWQPKIELSTLGTQAVSVGAAVMAWKKLIHQDLMLFDVLEKIRMENAPA